jgi:hypothetical protein
MHYWDPREDFKFSHMTRIWCWHKRYTLGDNDEEKPNSAIFNSFDELKNHIIKTQHPILIKPIRMYDHSGLFFSLPPITYPFNDRWDSGWVGFIFMTKKMARQVWPRLRVEKRIGRATKVIEDEFNEWSRYTSGFDSEEEPESFGDI